MSEHRFEDEWLARTICRMPGVSADMVQKLRAEKKPYLAQGLIAAGTLTGEAMAEAVEKAHGVVFVDPVSADIEAAALSLVPEKICRRHCLVPLRVSENEIVLAMANPIEPMALADVEAISGRRPKAQYCLRSRVEALLGEFYTSDLLIQGIADKFSENLSVEVIEGGGPGSDAADELEAISAPVTHLVNSIIAKAVRMGASDIHIEHEERTSVIRMRVDGLLSNIMTLPRSVAAHPMVSRIKIMANLDVAEHRRPQDGRAKLKVGGFEIGLRVSILPTTFGEKVVMRTLDPRSAQVPFDRLGFSPEMLAVFERTLSVSQGLLLVTGPTGSGKTTTLYSILNKLKTGDTNIVTVEDPVEYRLSGINQVQVNEKQGLTFPGVLRSVLRQDPDIILVGEIRDKETADTAFQAGLTGHFVLSTLHTNDALSTVTRLADMGVERFKLAPGLVAVTAQRLVRRLCTCRRPFEPALELLQALKRHGMPESAFKTVGCEACAFSGYKGRLSIIEFLEVGPALKERIAAGDSEAELRKFALAQKNLRPMLLDALWHVSQGDTSVDEISAYVSLQADPAAAAPPVPPSGRKVLIADDDAAGLLVLKRVLEQEGYRVTEARDGQEAAEAVFRERPDILLLDLQMPRMGGREVVAVLRGRADAVDLPIIILTADSDDKSQEEMLDLGADDYMTKPLKHPVLLARIRAVFRRRER